MSGYGFIAFIAVEPDGICEMCGVKAELRPYGPNNERICYDCGQKDVVRTEQKIREYIYGKENQ